MKHLTWLDSGREPQCPPNPAYPTGMDVDNGERPACKVTLPYPAPRCGAYIVYCDTCDTRAAITAAGRSDDPKTFMVPCKMKGRA